MADGQQCWFCGGDADARYGFRVGLHRDVEYRHYVVATRTEWTTILVDVPRCGGCRTRHYLEVLLFLMGLPTLAWGLGLLADTALGNYGAQPLEPLTVLRIGVWLVPFAAWLVLWRGWFGVSRWHPHNRRYVRQYPAVESLLEDDWRYGRAPLHQWDKRIPFGGD